MATTRIAPLQTCCFGGVLLAHLCPWRDNYVALKGLKDQHKDTFVRPKCPKRQNKGHIMERSALLGTRYVSLDLDYVSL